MFSGIIEATSSVISAEMRGECRRVTLQKPARWKLALGESVSVDGICSTVVAVSARSFAVEYMPETLSKTTAASFARGRVVNLERSLRYGARMHGHFVAGHVDARGNISAVEKTGRSRVLAISVPADLLRFIAPRGSVAVNGVSLTVARRGKDGFAVALIPHTLAHTNLAHLAKGGEVNVECDMLARYPRARRGATVGHHAKKRIRKKA